MKFLTKEKGLVHIFMASSEPFFLNWLKEKINDGIDPITISDLNKYEAQIYFHFLNPPVGISFEDVFALTGIFKSPIKSNYLLIVRRKYGFH